MRALFSELPETLTFVLGTWCSKSIFTRVCMQCRADDPKSFEDIAKEELPPITYDTGFQEGEQELVEKRANYAIQCKTCRHTFILQVRSFIDLVNENKILNYVYMLSEDGSTSYTQLGYFVSLVNENLSPPSDQIFLGKA
ncbi:MAG: hypothetical protein RBG13Loki_2047 [Promethearchaeota archaeon CR_4]|nr:MAG: hypothetical protein RBG13Loki_2047 [Candidatus Lokiarchaeota archaeon CR_4]